MGPARRPWRARWRGVSDWRGGRHRRADRAARTPDRRRHLREAGRGRTSGRPSGRSLIDQLAAPASRRRDRRRHVRRSAEPGGDQHRRRVGLARCAARAADRAGAGRRTASAGRRSRRVRTAVSSPAARPTSRRTSASTPDARQRRRARRTARRLAGAVPARAMRYLVLTDIHANLEALDACLPTRARAATTRRSCSAIWSATAPIPTPSSIASRRSNRSRSCAAITTRWRAGSSRPKASTPWRKSAAHGRSTSLTPEHRAGSRALPRADRRRRRRRDLPRLAVRRGRVHLRRARRRPRAEGRRTRPLCLFGHTHCPVTFELADDAFDSVGLGVRGRDAAADARTAASI